MWTIFNLLQFSQNILVTWPWDDVIGHVVKILKSSEMVQSPMYDIPLERGTQMQENEPSYDFIAQTVQKLCQF